MHTLWQDLRFGFHMIGKNPGFSAIAVLTLALGIGANTALFSVMDAVLLRKLPVREPDQLVLFNSVSPREFNQISHNGNNSRDPLTGLSTLSSFPVQTYQRLHEQRGLLTDIIAFGKVPLNASADGHVEVAQGQAVSGNYFSVLGVPAFAGRMLDESDDRANATPVAILGHRYWSTRFNSSNVIGKQITLNNVVFTIAGVAPPGFEGTMQVGSSQDIYLPIAWEPQVNGERSQIKGAVWWLRLMGRLKPGVTPEQARASLDLPFQQSVLEHRAVQEQLAKTEGSPPLPALETKHLPHLVAFSGSQGEMRLRNSYEKPLRLLFGVVLLVLVIACANVANLLLVRSSSRRKEIAVRLAMGASRWRLIRQLLTESLLLATIGGGVGILFALWIKDTLLAVGDWSSREMVGVNARLDLRVLGFTLAVSLLTGIIFGLVPALRASRLNLTPALKETGRSSTVATRSWLTKSLVMVQVSVSLLLLIGAGLLVRTLINLQRVETGFNESNLLLFTVEPGLIGYKEERLASLYQQVSERIEAVPGVTAATFSEMPLLSFSSDIGNFYLPGSEPGPNGRTRPSGELYLQGVRENFLETMQIPLLSGRTIKATDDARAPKVAVVNEAFARKAFPNQNPVGKRFGFEPKNLNEYEVIGLAKDAKYTSQRDDIPPTAYLSWRQQLPSLSGVTFEVRTTGDTAATVNAIRQAVREIDSNLPLKDIKTQVEQADETLGMERLFARLLTLFGLLAQQLAAIGLYGVLAWSVSQRTHEIGIRMALGANRNRVLQMILRQGMALTLAGVALGLGGAYVLTKYLESLTEMLYGVKPRDPLTFGVAAALLTLVGFVACFVPARRATKVDPLVALRYE